MKEFRKELVQLAAEGNGDAMEELYYLTYNTVFKTVKAMIRDEDWVLDILQDTYVKAFQRLSQLDKPETFPAWVKQIAINTARDQLKRKQPVLFTDMSDEDAGEFEIPDSCPENMPEAVLDRKETARLMEQILASLSDDQRMVIIMHYYEQMSVRQIAQLLDCSENTVKSRLNYGRKKIEAKVLELEKQGTKLYSLAPLPFLLWLLRMYAKMEEVPSPEVLEAVSGQCSASALSGASAAGGTAAAAGKIIAGVLAGSLLVFGAIAAAIPKQPEPQASQPTAASAWQNTEPTAVTQQTTPSTQVTQAAENPLDAILADIKKALTVSTEAYDADTDAFDSAYAHLGEGVMWMLMHRENGIYTLPVWYAYTDVDEDGQNELFIGRGLRSDSVVPIVIYTHDGLVILGDALYAYTDRMSGIAWEYLGG